MRLENTAAIVTGGSSGMGAAAARLLRANGAKVSILGRRRSLVETVATEIGALGLSCDVSDADQVEDAFDRAEQHHGPARILIHAAASGSMVPMLMPDGSAFDRDVLRKILETNVFGTLYVNQAFASRLSQCDPLTDFERGVIINVSSIGAQDGVVGSTYVMSKAGVEGFCLSAARELSPFRVRVVTIAPGAIDTEMFQAGATDATYALIGNSIPCPARVGAPAEFAALALHICENEYLNGCVIRLDGGMRIPFVSNVGGGSEVSETQ